ncbi:hypothetical protein BDP27DRAFT_1415184 [Rhodocollybia butyracea]|uniref:Glycosyltransferase 61 catalytic domain-containing protein n=1 Tax=Rhodocollybia butyracea TaxID=206335 RepID=A0A9P5Q5E4_9AGAR|nr:hypothetical protein BDP27DRAFT_1415184 [Rhodocollybia butyracea]
MILRHTISLRDAVLFMLGASLMHLVYIFFSPTPNETSFIISNYVHQEADTEPLPPPIDTFPLKKPVIPPDTPSEHVVELSPSKEIAAHLAPELPLTSIVHSAPGYTIFRNLYMSNGTLFIHSPNRSFPEIRMMISVSIPAEATRENMEAREPTPELMQFITPEEAQRRWGGDVANNVRNSVFTVEGNTALFNDPSQFLRHYYHFVAELFFGLQAFWHGAFSTPIESIIPDPNKNSNLGGKNWNAYPNDPQTHHKSLYQLHNPAPPPIHRSIFMHADARGWRDDPGFNSYFLRAAFPAMSVEHQEDWNDRVAATTHSSRDRAWLFPLVILVDRSAAFREDMTGGHTQRTAAQAWEYMRNLGRLRGERVGGFWEPLRDAVLRFAGAGDVLAEYRAMEMLLGGTEDNHADFSIEDGALDAPLELPMPSKVVVTYISRQGGSRRKLTPDSHESLVTALEELANRKDFELNVMKAETLTKDEQLQVIGRTTILLGVHGNGLTHLLFMPPTRVSAVIEIFYPGGFAHDYHWTSRALGMPHFAVWNDTYHTHPNEPTVDYPEGFQEDYIPVHGPTVAKIIEDRLDGKIGKM